MKFAAWTLASLAATLSYASAKQLSDLSNLDVIVDMTVQQDYQLTSHIRFDPRKESPSALKYLLPSLAVKEARVVHGDTDVVCAFYQKGASEPAGNVQFGPSMQPSKRTVTFDPPLTDVATLECDMDEESWDDLRDAEA